MLKRLLIFFLFVLTVASGISQQFGGNPPSLKWKQISVAPARIIYPRGEDSLAADIASIIQSLAAHTTETAGPAVHRVNILLQNQTTISNGYVALAPFRSEFQVTPDQNNFALGSLPWHKLLAIHEYRHVQQYNNFRVGLSRGFYYLFGESGQEFANSISVPNWFWEGDAVYQETLVSEQGRGRIPFFFGQYGSLWAADKNYSWMKLRNGSLRDYIPDHYPLGYLLVAYGRMQYGDNFWKQVTHDAAAFHGLFYPIQKAIKKYSGSSFPAFRAKAIGHFTDELAKEKLPVDLLQAAAKQAVHFSGDEEFPQWTADGSLVFVRSTYRHRPAFILRGKDGEKKIRIKDISIDNYFSYRNGKIVYSAYATDPRWGWRDYADLQVIDVETGNQHTVKKRTKYFSPDISSDGKKIITVEVAPGGRSRLVLLNAETGDLLTVISNRESYFYTAPKFAGSDAIVTAVRDRQGRMALLLVHPENGQEETLTRFSWNTIGFPSVSGDTVFFSGSTGNHDRIFSVQLSSHLLCEAEHPQLQGATNVYAPSAGGDSLVYAGFTATGYREHAVASKEIRWRPVGENPEALLPITFGLDLQKRSNARILDSVHTEYPVPTKYAQSGHLFNFHSWRPYITDPDYSLSLVSNNLLNTFQTEFFADYNRNELYTQLGASLNYAQLYPVIDATANYTFNRNAFFRGNTVYWNETEIAGGLSVPLNFTRGKTITQLSFGSDIVYNQRYFQGNYKDSFDTRGYAYSGSFLNFSHQVQQAKMQIYPSWAQSVSVLYKRVVTRLEGNQFLASGYFYFPGMISTHSLEFTAAFHQRDSINEIRFTNQFPFSRGYSAENFYRMWRFGVNYHFPLAYPDWGFGGIIYFLRIRANLFYDHTSVLDYFTNGDKFNPQYRSAGTEIFFDTKFWNQLPVSFGIRYARLLDPDFEGRAPNQWEFVLPLNLLSR